jgi:potassium-dependent mechanosensitive channel
MMAIRPVLRVLSAFLFVIWAGFAAAQATAPDYSEWEAVAKRAENAVESAEASDEAFATLRGEVAEWRQKFQTQLSTNDSRLQTLREQIQSLGPVPEEGASEVPEIAARRAELNSQLERLSTPRRTAEEAFSRANGVIAEIDDLLRQRQAEELLRMGPWPLNPANWSGAFRQATQSAVSVVAGVQQAWQNPARRLNTQDNLPLIIILLAVGVVLLSRSRYWSEWLAVRIQRGDARSSAGVASFVVSLGQILLPMLGLFAMVRAIAATQLFGQHGKLLLETLEPMGLFLFFSLWLASRFFPRSDALHAPLTLTADRRTEGRIYTFLLAIVSALAILLERFAEFDRYEVATSAVLHFPLIVVAGLCLMRMGWLLRRDLGPKGEEEGGERRNRFVAVFGQAVIVLGLTAPVLAAFGYVTAAKALIYPAILTLALYGTVVLLQGFVREVYAAIRPGEGAAESLIPTLIGFLLVLLAMPVLALIWGARVTDLTEMWAAARFGLTVGDLTISPGSFFTLILVFFVGYLITRGVQGAMKTSVLPKTRIDPGGQTAIVSGLGYVGIFLAALIAITSAGIDLSSLAIVAGALSVGIGFGLQTVVSNFVSGIILLIERPISEGDWIEVGGQMGYVRAISVRSTRIETFDRTDVIVPNADLISGTVTNYTRGNTVGRVIVPVGVAYGTDTRKVDRILKEIADAHPMALTNPEPMILFAGFGADSLNFEIRMVLRDVNWSIVVRNELNHQIAARFAEEGIEIPFAQRDIWLRNPEVLQANRSETGQTPADSAKPETAHLEPEDISQDETGNETEADGDGEPR